MRAFSYPITDILTKGLAPAYNRRNQPLLVQSIGAVAYEGVLQAVEQFSTINISALGAVTFPYPQLFVLSDAIVVCTATALYELNGSTLTPMITGLIPGETWQALDFKTFLYFTNGEVAVTKDPVTGLYAVDTSVPYAQAACNFNGQVLLGAPRGI